MIKIKDIIRIRPLFIIVTLLIITLYFIVDNEIYQTEDIDFYKEFLSTNTAIQDFFGEIQGISLVMIKGSKVKKKQNGQEIISRQVPFKIMGTKRKGCVLLSWEKINDKISYKSIAIRNGFVGTQSIWPSEVTTYEKSILPPNVWDGIFLIIVSVISFYLYLDICRSRMITRFIFFYLDLGKIKYLNILKYIFLLSAIGSMVHSILCFFDITSANLLL